MRYRGVLGTLIRPRGEGIKYEFAAIDGTIVQEPGVDPLVIIAVVKGVQEGLRTTIYGFQFHYETCYSCEPAKLMEELEFSLAEDRGEEVVFLDRSIETRRELKREVIAVAKDFMGKEAFVGYSDPPYLVPLDADVRSAVFQFYPGTGPFLVQTNSDLPWINVAEILFVTSHHPVPEALGYVYPLYLADKAVKYEWGKVDPAMRYFSMHSKSYRAMRSVIERRRLLGRREL